MVSTRIVNGEYGGMKYTALQYHHTMVCIKWGNGNVSLYAKEWRTVTTKSRMNTWLVPYHCMVSQEKMEWWLNDAKGNRVPFHDGITVGSNGVHMPNTVMCYPGM